MRKYTSNHLTKKFESHQILELEHGEFLKFRSLSPPHVPKEDSKPDTQERSGQEPFC